MTTIGLVSAGLLTFPQGLGLVFGANVGTTGTAWLVALIGVRVSLSTYALPMIFVGALLASVAPGQLTATEAFARIDAARRLGQIAHHAWRSTAHLLGRGVHPG